MNRELIGENKKKFISYKNILNKSNFLNKEQEQIKTNLFLFFCKNARNLPTRQK